MAWCRTQCEMAFQLLLNYNHRGCGNSLYNKPWVQKICQLQCNSWYPTVTFDIRQCEWVNLGVKTAWEVSSFLHNYWWNIWITSIFNYTTARVGIFLLPVEILMADLDPVAPISYSLLIIIISLSCPILYIYAVFAVLCLASVPDYRHIMALWRWQISHLWHWIRISVL